MSLLLVLLLGLVALLLGSLQLKALGGRCLGPAFELATGLVALHVLLRLMDLLTIPWRPELFAPLVVVLLGLPRWIRALPPPASPPGWGDGVALTSLVVLAVFAERRMIASPDFIYHWGLKAKRFALAGGPDTAWLQDPASYYVHPDYPNLLPDLTALLTVLRRTFHEETCLLVSVLVTAAILLACRQLLVRADVPPATLQAGMAWISCALLSFSVSWQMTGNADGLICLAVLLGIHRLGGELGRESDIGIGVAAALAAASKIEGVVLAVCLLVVHLHRRARAHQLTVRAVLRSSWLPMVPLLLWVNQVVRLDLMQDYYTGDFALDRLALALRSALSISLRDGWHGQSLLALLLVPWLLAAGGWAARSGCVMLAMLGFHFWVYATAPADTALLVSVSFPRLMMHLVPAILILALWRFESVVRDRPGGRLPPPCRFHSGSTTSPRLASTRHCSTSEER